MLSRRQTLTANVTWGHIVKKKKKIILLPFLLLPTGINWIQTVDLVYTSGCNECCKRKEGRKEGPIDGWTASGGGGQWWGGGRRIVAFRLPEYIQTFIGVTRSLLHAFMSCLNVVAWGTPRQGKMQGSRRESWYWWRVKGWRGWQEREKRQKWGLSGGWEEEERAGGFKSTPPPRSAKSRTLANWWRGRSQTARATKIGKVNETEESIWAAPYYHVNDGGGGVVERKLCFLITPLVAIMILPFDSLSFPISVPLRRCSGPRWEHPEIPI